MSLILDALRKGRARPTPPPPASPRAAQTDAVLQTLGYGRFQSPSSSNRTKQLAAYIAVALVLAIAVWAIVAWGTHTYLTGKPPLSVNAVNVVNRAQPFPAATPRHTPAPATPPATAPVVVATGDDGSPQSRGSGPQTPEASPQHKPVTTPAAAPAQRGAPPAPVPVQSPVAGAPSAAQAGPIVHASRRSDVPTDMPLPPTGAPSSRTALSVSAGSNAGKVVSESDHFQLALYYQRVGDFENSLVHYRAVLQRDELNAEAHNNLGLLYRGKGLLDDAVKEFGRAIAINQKYVKAHNNLGVAYLSQGRNDAAAAEFRTALGIDPRNVESLVNLSLAEKEAGQRVDARATLARAIEIDPRSAEAHYNLALIADDMGDKALALAQYRIFLQYGSDHPDLVPDVRRRIDALNSEAR